jgi:hypothetical protein
MSDKKTKDSGKRLSKGQRKHVRRLKQAARKESNQNNPQSSRPPEQARVPKDQVQS